MKTSAVITLALAVVSGPVLAQDNKPVPKDSVRVFVPGCTKGYIFTASRRHQDEPGKADIHEGMDPRMKGPKIMTEVHQSREGARIRINGEIAMRLPKMIGVTISPSSTWMPR